MTKIADLSEDMFGEILSRVPLTSLSAVRSTCKTWNDSSRKQVLGEKGAKKNQFMEFMIRDHNLCSLRFDLQKVCNDKDDEKDLMDPSMKQISIPNNQHKVHQVYHCDGLLLCVTGDKDYKGRFLVWNPYMGQTRWIRLRIEIRIHDAYALGYGYDDNNNRNHKILRLFYDYHNKKKCAEVYDFRSDSWRVIDDYPDWHELYVFEGKCIPFRDEKLAVFRFVYENDPQIDYEYEQSDIMEIWISTKIEPNAISWSIFLRLDMRYFDDLRLKSFFIDEEKKVAVFLSLNRFDETKTCGYRMVNIVGEDGYLKSFKMEEVSNYWGASHDIGLVCSSYVPSLVQLQINQPDKTEEINQPDKTEEKINQPDESKQQTNQPDETKEKINHSDKTKEQINQPDEGKQQTNQPDETKEKINHSDKTKEQIIQPESPDQTKEKINQRGKRKERDDNHSVPFSILFLFLALFISSFVFFYFIFGASLNSVWPLSKN
ncbi:unnamed protein product [Microthlaspi erraticum]|uniref:F-box domain-containing protein n=1 Tax=Microthlaspi erraticum TaxID=1685480 RepID=A0A6D2ITH0_9BRAS|nr:unnamed protein product [Microthlaspi erraticum]